MVNILEGSFYFINTHLRQYGDIFKALAHVESIVKHLNEVSVMHMDRNVYPWLFKAKRESERVAVLMDWNAKLKNYEGNLLQKGRTFVFSSTKIHRKSTGIMKQYKSSTLCIRKVNHSEIHYNHHINTTLYNLFIGQLKSGRLNSPSVNHD